jgi:hypothetical protein
MVRILGTLYAELHTFMAISGSILLRMKNGSDKSCRENQNTHFVSNRLFSGNRVVYEIILKIYGTLRQATTI